MSEPTPSGTQAVLKKRPDPILVYTQLVKMV